jgi:predicted porin
MQKKLIVLALASAFAAPAFAATSNVDIYGQFDVSVDRVSGLKSTFAASTQKNTAWRLSSNASRIGLKGSEDLGGGLAAIWQFEQGVTLDAGGAASAWGNSRNTFLGLKGAFGTVLAGTHDTPYKLSTASLDPFADTIGDYNAIIGAFDGYNTSDLRLGNVLAYISPNFSGFTGAVATSFLKETGSDNTSTTHGSPSAWSGMVNYANGPLYLAVGFEDAKHLTPISGNIDIRSWKLGAGYTFGNFVVNAIYDNIKATENLVVGTASDSAKRHAWGLNGVYNMGNIALKAGFYMAGKTSSSLGGFTGTTDTGAKLWELGGDYNLSKRTKLYAVYEHVNNEAQAGYCAGGAISAGFGGSGVNIACGGDPSNSDGVDGKDPSAFAIGMRHTF